MSTLYCVDDDLTTNYIEYEYQDNLCWIKMYYVDPDNPKFFIILLKENFSKMKEFGCTKYQQYVSKDDWDNILCSNDKWKKIKFDEILNAYLIECDIDYATENIVDGFLFKNDNEK